ncbi:hypothetical protein [Arenibaculum sp.]|jgi:hypothetical protein|uniref:hypothetical protein n=1 Tax=Arenibaculum sp. TaxID=2865862 RepID=UPI002E15A6C7|nr:hypothetical protein [Arenibaculum sp.]
MPLFRRTTTAGPLHHLRRDACTPNGTIWTCFADLADMSEVADGVIADAEHRLSVGDIINMRPNDGSERPALRLRVTARADGEVRVRKLHG